MVLNGTNSKKKDFARGILNYPAMMVPSVQEPIINIISKYINEDINLIDPFMGASNSLVTGMKSGMNVFGQDINPLSLLLSQVKVSFFESGELTEALERINQKISIDLSSTIEVSFSNIDKWFKKSIQIDLSKIFRAIRFEKSLKIRKFFWVVLAETIRISSNDRTSTFKLHIRSVEDIQNRKISALKTFDEIGRRNINEIVNFVSVLQGNGYIRNGAYFKDAEVVFGDTNAEIRTKKKFNLLVTSPPYGDNQTTVTYGQFSYLPLQWIPSEDIDKEIPKDYLNTYRDIDNKSLGGQSKKHITEIEDQIFKKSITLQKFIFQFEGIERKKAEKVTRFINDLDNSIENMLPKLNKNSILVWTVGNRSVNKQMVQNDRILEELFDHKGIKLFTTLEREILSKRMPGKNNFSNMMSKEKILIFKKNY